MYILNVCKKVLGIIISFEVTTHQPPILFLPVDSVLVDCCLSFAHRWIGINRNMSKSKGWTLQSSLLMLWMEKTRVNNQTKIDDDVNLLKTL